MKALLLSFLVLMGSMTIAPKKAEAGILFLTAATVVTSGAIVVAALGGYIVIDGATNSTYDSWSGGLKAFYIVLDADEAILMQDTFKTIPAYIFDEINTIAEEKKYDAILVKENVKELLLTNVEVDELFSTLDESVDQEELNQLRAMLTLSIVK